jgi:hypothetical protein
VALYDALVTVKGALRAVSLYIAGKPLVKVLCHCEASRRCIYAFIKAR